MTLAAVAMLCGHGDPLALLEMTGDDLRIATAVVNRANDIRIEEAQNMASNIGHATARWLAKALR